MNTSENSVLNEGWQAQINFQIQQTTLEELKSLLNDGKLQPTDKVRIKNLPWVEAQRVPAFQKLFESKRTKNSVQPNKPENPPAPPIETKPETKVVPELNQSAPANPDNNTVKANLESVEPSIPFKIYNQKTQAKNKQTDLKPRQFKSLPKKNKKTSITSIIKKTVSFLAGCVLTFLLALGGSYLWVFQLKSPIKIDEKSITELVILKEKLATDKVGLRLKVAAIEQESAANNQENPTQKIDSSQEFAKLETQFDVQRKVIIENYRKNLINNEFNNTFYGSLAVLMILFLIFRIFYSKKEQPVESDYTLKSSKSTAKDALNGQSKVETVNSDDVEDSPDIHTTKLTDAHTTTSPDIHKTKSSNSVGTIDDFLQSSEYLDYVEQDKVIYCLLHREERSKFVCEICSNHFCEDCPKTINEIENCCPFCKVACKTLDSKTPNSKTNVKTTIKEVINEDADAEVIVDYDQIRKIAKPKRKPLVNFTIYDYPDDKTRRLSIFGAFLIALLFSTSISIFWVYKISPYLEKRDAELSQNTDPNEKQKSEKSNPATIAQPNANTQVSNTNVAANAADERCIDPQSNQPFECDDETRKALYDHTRKTKSVEDAKKQVNEKTNTILSLVSPSASPANENSEIDEKQNAIDEERRQNEKRLFIKVFGASFLTIFGLLLSTRLFGKE